MVDSLRTHGKSFAVVDLGDFTNNEATVGELKTRFIWNLMERTGYIATTPGVRELNAWTTFRDLVAASPIACVSSNLTLVEGGVEKPAGLPTFVTDIGGVRAGFFALMGGNELSSAKPPAGIEFRHKDPIHVAQTLVPELRKQAEVVVLLSQLSPNETDDLLNKVPGIDVALYGRNPGWNDRAKQVGSTITQQTGIRGQFIGELVLIVDPDARIVDWGSRNGPLDTKYGENAETSAAIKQTENDARTMLKVDQEKKSSELEGKISSEKFVGVDKCQRCHETQYQQWVSTPHARAFATLDKDNKNTDTACVGCHVTGWQKTGGYAENVPDPNLQNVQCEACHGVGTTHDRAGQMPKVTKEVCTTCHTGDWAKGFDFATYLPKVSH